ALRREHASRTAECSWVPMAGMAGGGAVLSPAEPQPRRSADMGGKCDLHPWRGANELQHPFHEGADPREAYPDDGGPPGDVDGDGPAQRVANRDSPVRPPAARARQSEGSAGRVSEEREALWRRV